MQLNPNGLLARFYMWLPPEDGQLPKDLCTFVWGLAFRLLFLSFFAFIALVILYWIWIVITWSARLIWQHPFTGLAMVLSFALVVLLIWLNERRSEVFDEMKLVVRTKVDGFKGQYCPTIEWKERNK